MKKTISILLLLILLFFIFEFEINYFKKEHETTYKIYVEDNIFNITENYKKENGNSYSIKIEHNGNKFHYSIKNNYNKQKKIIKKIEYFNDNNNICIYPVLNDDKGSYIECIKDNIVYTASSYMDQNFINQVKQTLEEKGYKINKVSDTQKTDKYIDSIIYTNNLKENDIITLWTYKGINIIGGKENHITNVLNFDKYENNHGYLVNNYYIIPNYLSSRVLEFSSVNIINLDTNKIEKLDLGYTLSSDTYINGIVDNKLYYTDPSNLIQIEINPKNSNVRLIGSKEIGGIVYNGKWENTNIYDLKNKVLFKNELPNINYSYKEIFVGESSYYFYNNSGEVYQLSKTDLDIPVLLFKTSDINNFNVIADTVYFVSNDTVYYYNNEDGLIPIIKNNELRYNTFNRIGIYRKS